MEQTVLNAKPYVRDYARVRPPYGALRHWFRGCFGASLERSVYGVNLRPS